MSLKVDTIITERVIKKLEEGVVPWRRPWSYGNAISRAGRFYTGINAFLIPNGEWITFNQIKKEGGKLNKGSESELVIGHMWKEEDNGAGGTSTQYKGRRYFRVFNILDTDLEPKHTDKWQREEKEFDLTEAHELFDKLIADYCKFEQIKLRIYDTNEAFYSPSMDLIEVPEMQQYKDVSKYCSTLAHEAIHSTGNQSRLKRIEHATFGNIAYSKEELVAELGAAMLTQEMGVATEESFDNTAAYIQSWIKKLQDNPSWIFWASGKAVKAKDFIFEKAGHTTKAEELKMREIADELKLGEVTEVMKEMLNEEG